MSFRSLLFLAALAALLFWTKPWTHRVGRGDGLVTGKAVDANGHGVSGASIVIRDAKGVVLGRTESGSNGDFTFERCPVGRLRIAAGRLEIGGGERVVLLREHQHVDTTVPLTGPMMTAGH